MTASLVRAAVVATMLISAGCAREPRPVIYDIRQPSSADASPRKPVDYPFPSDGRIRIFFEFGSAALTPIPEEILDNAAAGWRLCPDESVTIAGHTDGGESGPGATNLSRHRAETVRAGLVARGGDPARISVEGFGSSRPALASPQGARQAVNRRVDITIPCLLRPES